MRRPLLAACLALLAARPAAALPTADEVKAHVRRAVGYDAFRKLPDGLAFEGTAEFFGIPGTFTMRLHPDGRYVRVIEAAGTQGVGFVGKTRWGCNFSNPPLDLHFEEADRDRYLFGVLCHRWLAADGGFTARVDEKTSRAYLLDLVLSHPDAGVGARLAIDTATWLPATLDVPSAHRGRVFDFADYRPVAGVTVPVKVGQNRYEGGQWIDARRAGPPPAGGPDPFVRPARPPSVTFDPTVPARLESRKAPGGMILVRAAVNGEPGLWFLLDTGNATQTAVTAAYADRLGLPAAGGARVSGAGGGDAHTRFRPAASLALGPVTLANPVLNELPPAFGRAVSAIAGVEVGGCVGQDVLSAVVLELDPAAGTAAAYDPKTYALPAGGAWEPVRFNGRAPCVRAAFDGAAGWYSFDTGFEAPLIFERPAAARLKLPAGPGLTPRMLFGVGGGEEVVQGPGGEFRVFGRAARTARTLYATDPAGGHTDPYTVGCFGPSALGPGTVVLDYAHARIGFVPAP